MNPLLEDCPLTGEDTLKRHDWEILNTEPAYKFSSGENCTITITSKRWFSLLRCKRCGKPIRVWED